MAQREFNLTAALAPPSQRRLIERAERLQEENRLLKQELRLIELRRDPSKQPLLSIFSREQQQRMLRAGIL